MKILHTSDWHLGIKEGEHLLYEDQMYFIHQLCTIVAERKIDAVLVAGDVYDNSRGTAEANRQYSEAVTRLCDECGATVFVIAGNHDGADRLAVCNKLLCKTGLHIKGELSADLQPVVMEDCEFFLLPWITEEKVKSVFPEAKESINDLTDAYRTVTDRMRQLFTPGRRHIAIAHAFLTGAETSTSDRAAEIGFATQVPASVFQGFDYVALGHLHGPHPITENARYCGTPVPYSFGREEKQTKGVVVVDTETMEQEFVPLKLLHKRTTLECTLEEALNPAWDEEVLKGYVRLIVSDSYIGLATLSDLRQIYEHLLVVQGKSFESENGTISLSVDELEQIEADPVAVFKYFCREETGQDPDEHLTELFCRAVEEVEKEEDQ